MSVHILGLGSVGVLCAHVLRTENPLLRILYLPRPSSSPPAQYTLFRPDGRHIQLAYCVNDAAGTEPIEVLLVTTKAHQIKTALDPHLYRITRDTLTIFLQNGMGIVDSVRDKLPSKRIVVGTTTMAAYRIDQSRVQWIHKGRTLFSPEPPTSLSPNEEKLVLSLGEIVPYPVLEEQMFRKLALNACINPVTAIYNVSNSDIADETSAAHDLSMCLAREIQQVYAASRPDMDMSLLTQEVMQLAIDTRKNTSSMLADVRAGRKTEIDFINGYIIRMGCDAGINVHKHKSVVSKVKDLKK